MFSLVLAVVPVLLPGSQVLLVQAEAVLLFGRVMDPSQYVPKLKTKNGTCFISQRSRLQESYCFDFLGYPACFSEL